MGLYPSIRDEGYEALQNNTNLPYDIGHTFFWICGRIPAMRLNANDYRIPMTIQKNMPFLILDIL